MNTTTILEVDATRPDGQSIARAARIIMAGGLVAFPTETVYGLGANALDADASGKIYEAKQRSPDDPCIVHIASLEGLERVATVEVSQIEALASKFWPGPLSLVVPKSEEVPGVVTAQRATVAVRIPDHPVALALIREAGVPIAAPSANTFMHTSPTNAQHVWDDLAGRIDLILDGGPSRIGVESTVLDMTGEVPTLLRPGGASLEDLRSVLGEVVVLDTGIEQNDTGGAKSPGLLKKHYAPRAEVTVFDGPRERVLHAIRLRALALIKSGKTVGVLAADEDLPELGMLPGIWVSTLGNQGDLDTIATKLFAALRELENHEVDAILGRVYGSSGVGLAIQDRLIRAAGGVVVQV